MKEEKNQNVPGRPENGKPSSGWRRYWPWAGGVSLLTALLPFITRLGVVGKYYFGRGDLEGWLWRYWWMKQLLGTLLSQPQKDWSMIIYTYLCAGNYPETGNVFDLQTLSLILEPIFKAPLYYNVKIILILILNGLAGYALFNYISKKPALSLMGPVIINLNPYVISEILEGRPRQTMLFSIPMYIIALDRAFESNRLKDALMAGGWLGLTAVIYLYYGMAALFFSIIFLFYKWAVLKRKFPLKFLKRIPVIIGVFLLITLPFSIRYLELLTTRQGLPEVRYFQSLPDVDFLQYSQKRFDVTDTAAQSAFRYRLGSLSGDFMFHTGRRLFIPWVFLLMALAPLIWTYKKPPWLWIITFVFFTVLCLGPYLKWGTAEAGYVRTLSGRAVPLPFGLFYKYVPFFSRLHVPRRLLGMAMIALLGWIAANVRDIYEKYGKLRAGGVKIRGAAVGVVAVLTIVHLALSGWMIMPLTGRFVPEFYRQLGKDNARFGIIEAPYRVSTGDFMNYYQTFHRKKLVFSWAHDSVPAGFPDSTPRYLSRPNYRDDNTFLKFLESLNHPERRPAFFNHRDLQALKKSGYRYLVVHEYGCHLQDPAGGAMRYSHIMSEINRVLGPPWKEEMVTVNWSPPEKDKMFARFRVTVFRLDD